MKVVFAVLMASFVGVQLLTAGSSAFAAFQVDKNLLVPAVEASRDVDAEVQGMVLGEDAKTAFVELFSNDESAQIQKAGYECSAPIFFLNAGGYRRLCGYVDRSPPVTGCAKGKKVCVAGPMGGIMCVPQSHVCPFVGCPNDPWSMDCDKPARWN